MCLPDFFRTQEVRLPLRFLRLMESELRYHTLLLPDSADDLTYIITFLSPLS